MTTRELREDYSSNVVRVLHPTCPLSPNNGAIDNDNNLDNLLDDLQSSVSHSKNESSYSTKSRDVQYLSPTNTSTIIKERSVSPAGENRRVYKKSHYEYSSSSNTGVSPSQAELQKNINSLDTLLLDLKHERDASLDRDKNFSNIGIDSGLLDSNTRVTKSSRTYTSNSSDGYGKTTANREYNLSPIVTTETTTTRQSRPRNRSPVFQKDIETKVTRDVSYESEPIVDSVVSKTSSINRSYKNYNTSSRSVDHQIVPYNNEVVEVKSSNLSNELDELPLSENLLPGPGTKVTTTIKTFTYEIPGDTQVSTNKHFKYQNDTYNTNNTTTFAERDIPPPTNNQTTIYKTENYNTINRTHDYSGYPDDHRPRSPMPEPVSNKTVIYKRETRDTSSNYTSPTRGHPNNANPPGQSTVIYKHDVTNTNTNVHHPPAGGVPVFPHDPSLPAGHPGPKHTYIYKKEINNTKNTVYGHPGNPNDKYPSHDYPDNKALPPQGYPNEPPTTTYKYYKDTSTTTTTRNIHPDRQPLLAPFPTNDIEPIQGDGNPPKRLDDLLATLGDHNGRSNEEPYTPRKEVNTSLTTGKAVAIVEPKVPTKNIAGPPVYYPPNHELFTKSEQSAAAWRAQGGYGNARGKYEYEAGSKSKSSSKSGGAMVPVCLPLCCAMPCVIM